MSRKKQKRKSGLKIIAIAVLILCAVVTYNRVALEGKRRALEKQYAELNEQLLKEQERADRLLEQERYMQTVEGIRETMERSATRAQDEAYRAAHPTDPANAEGLHTELTNVNVTEGDVYREQTTYEQTQNIDKRNLSTIEQELSRINRENINNQYKYMQMMEGIRESMERPQEKKSPDQMRRESLMALEHPAELMKPKTINVI